MAYTRSEWNRLQEKFPRADRISYEEYLSYTTPAQTATPTPPAAATTSAPAVTTKPANDYLGLNALSANVNPISGAPATPANVNPISGAQTSGPIPGFTPYITPGSNALKPGTQISLDQLNQ